jgi:hypothetical protein
MMIVDDESLMIMMIVDDYDDDDKNLIKLKILNTQVSKISQVELSFS